LEGNTRGKRGEKSGVLPKASLHKISIVSIKAKKSKRTLVRKNWSLLFGKTPKQFGEAKLHIANKIPVPGRHGETNKSWGQIAKKCFAFFDMEVLPKSKL